MGIFDSLKRKFGYDVKNNNGVNEEYWDSYKQGKILKKKYFKKNGRLHGKYYEYNWNENDHWIDIEANYSEGKKHGVTKYFWKKHISAEGKYINGELIGEVKKYFRFGDELRDPALHPVVKESADLEKGVYKVFSLNGKCLENSIIDGVIFQKGSSSSADGYYGGIYPIRNGLCEKWFENGKLKESGYWGKNNTSSIYNLSHRKGEHIQFYENGNKFKEGEWIDKSPVGIHKFYYPNGNVQFEVEYSHPTNKGYDSSFPERENIVREKWYNEDGSLMNVDQIIEKGGIDPRQRKRSGGIKVFWSHETLNQVNFITINDMGFKRMGEIKFYESYYTTSFSLGHSYSRT